MPNNDEHKVNVTKKRIKEHLEAIANDSDLREMLLAAGVSRKLIFEELGGYHYDKRQFEQALECYFYADKLDEAIASLLNICELEHGRQSEGENLETDALELVRYFENPSEFAATAKANRIMISLMKTYNYIRRLVESETQSTEALIKFTEMLEVCIDSWPEFNDLPSRIALN